MTYPFQKWLPVVDMNRCTGCGKCVEACGPRSLTLANGMAVLSGPDSCGSEEHCIAPCPEKAIQMQWISFKGNPKRGLWKILK